MAEMDALISDVKKMWERAGRGQGTIMYAAMFTKYSATMAGQLSQRVIQACGLTSFEDMHVFIDEIIKNFDPQKLGDHFTSVKYPQFSTDGAVIEAVLFPVEDFLTQRMPLIKHSDKMISPKTFIP